MGRKKNAEAERKKRKLLGFIEIGGAVTGVMLALMQRTAGTGTPPCSPKERLVVKDEENLGGLGAIMKAVIGEYLKDPDKVKMLDTMNLVLAIEPTDQPETASTFTFSNGCVIIEPGVALNLDLKIMCTMEMLGLMSQMTTRQTVKKLRTGELKIKGLAKHPLRMMKFSKFLAPPADETAAS